MSHEHKKDEKRPVFTALNNMACELASQNITATVTVELDPPDYFTFLKECGLMAALMDKEASGVEMSTHDSQILVMPRPPKAVA